jgi:hypothetical protein
MTLNVDTKPKYIGADYVPKEVVELQDELSRPEHQHIRQTVEAAGYETFSESLGTVAAECGIILDGYYSEEDIVGLCKTLVDKLRQKRSPIVYR